MEKELKQYGLHFRESDSPDRDNIDFVIEDENDNVCWVWGDNPRDIEWECTHPIVDFDDNEPVGECLLCGCSCDCHYEADNGNVEDYAWSGRKLVPHEWYPRREIGGIVGDYIKQLREEM